MKIRKYKIVYGTTNPEFTLIQTLNCQKGGSQLPFQTWTAPQGNNDNWTFNCTWCLQANGLEYDPVSNMFVSIVQDWHYNMSFTSHGTNIMYQCLFSINATTGVYQSYNIYGSRAESDNIQRYPTTTIFNYRMFDGKLYLAHVPWYQTNSTDGSGQSGHSPQLTVFTINISTGQFTPTSGGKRLYGSGYYGGTHTTIHGCIYKTNLGNIYWMTNGQPWTFPNIGLRNFWGNQPQQPINCSDTSTGIQYNSIPDNQWSFNYKYANYQDRYQAFNEMFVTKETELEQNTFNVHTFVGQQDYQFLVRMPISKLQTPLNARFYDSEGNSVPYYLEQTDGMFHNFWLKQNLSIGDNVFTFQQGTSNQSNPNNVFIYYTPSSTVANIPATWTSLGNYWYDLNIKPEFGQTIEFHAPQPGGDNQNGSHYQIGMSNVAVTGTATKSEQDGVSYHRTGSRYTYNIYRTYDGINLQGHRDSDQGGIYTQWCGFEYGENFTNSDIMAWFNESDKTGGGRTMYGWTINRYGTHQNTTFIDQTTPTKYITRTPDTTSTIKLRSYYSNPPTGGFVVDVRIRKSYIGETVSFDTKKEYMCTCKNKSGSDGTLFNVKL